MGGPGFVAGVDCSTQSTKVLVVDAGTGEVVATGRANHEVSGTGGARETDPRVWWEALGQAMAATGMASDIMALSIGGQQHGLVVLDDHGEPLRPAMLWNDVRSAAQAQELKERWGAEAWADRIGVVPVASFTITKWVWLTQNEPGIAISARRVMLPHDYTNFRLTGTAATDRGDASGTGWWSSATEQYSTEALDLAGLDGALLPTMVGPGESAGAGDRGGLGRDWSAGRHTGGGGNRRQHGRRPRARSPARPPGGQPWNLGHDLCGFRDQDRRPQRGGCRFCHR